MNIYLQLESSTGKLYEYSKTEKDGFVRHEVEGNDGSKKIAYRRYYDNGIFGTLLGMSRREQDMGGKKVMTISCIFETVEQDRIFINVPLFNAKSDIQNYAIALISYLPSLQVGKAYRFYPFAIEQENSDRKTYGVSIKHARLSDNAVDNINKIPRLTFEVGDGNGGVKTPGDIPRTEYDIVMDKPTPNNKARNTYLWEKLKACEILPNLSNGSGNTALKTFDSTKPEEEAVTPSKAEEEAFVKASKPVLTQDAIPPTSTNVASAPKTAIQPNAEFDSMSNSGMTQEPASKAAAIPTQEDDDDDIDDLPF